MLRRPAVLALALILAAATALTPQTPAPAGQGISGPLACGELRLDPSRRASSIVLVVNDTMRRDRVGAYGGPARTPAFDAFARGNLLFDRAFTQAPWTTPSIATLFTSLYPSQHGVVSHPKIREQRGKGSSPAPAAPLEADVLVEGFTTLAETLRLQGYRTAAFVGNPWLERRFGFAQGFDVYDDSFAGWETPGSILVRKAIDWLKTLDPSQRSFLYLHTMDSHQPYPALTREELRRNEAAIRGDPRSVSPVTSRRIAELVRLVEGPPAVTAGYPATPSLLETSYDLGLSDFDAALGRLLEGLEALPSWGRTAVIVTSDHGEALFARGYGNHGKGLYDDELAIPLAARLPGVSFSEARVGCPVGLVDLMPTLCGYLGAACPGSAQGENLLARSGPGAPRGERHVFHEGVMHRPGNRAIRSGTHKLILQPEEGPDGSRDALFDLLADPGETRDLLAGDSLGPEVEAIRAALLRAAGEAVRPFERPSKESTAIDTELERRLRSLGYIQ